MKKKKSISIASRKNKGRILQKWVAQKISDITGIKCGKDELIESREMGQKGTDIKLIGKAKSLFKFAVECKRTEKLDLYGSIKQAKANQKDDTDWLLIHRRSGDEAIAIIKADTFFKLVENTIQKRSYFDKTPESIIHDTHINKNNSNFSGETH